MFRIILIFIAAVGLSGCATLNEDECTAGDWSGIGFNDGSKGRGPSYFDRHIKACAEYGVAPAQSPWLEGRDRGLRVYCRPSNAYRIGRRGARIAPYCSSVEAAEMEPAYRFGLRYYKISEEIDDLKRDEDDLLAEIAALSKEDDSAREIRAIRRELRSIRLDILALELRSIRFSSWP